MMAWMEEFILVKVGHDLFEDDLLQYFTQYRQERNRPIIFGQF